MTAGVPAPTPATPTPALTPAPIPSSSEWEGAEGGVRGGHVFGYLAGKSGSSGGTDVGEGSEHFLPLSRENSGVSDLIFGMETSGVSCCSFWATNARLSVLFSVLTVLPNALVRKRMHHSTYDSS